MISLNNVGSAGQALHYFSKDNYYTKQEELDHSAWFGQGAARLGLSGQIEPPIFLDLLHGKIADQQLGKWVKNPETGKKERQHRPGLDITFSAPKSVSLLAEIDGQQAVREAHEMAVKEALAYIEKNLIAARITQDGKTELIKTQNMVVSLFRHNTSRDLDPQTHTHAVIINATLCQDGRWRSIVNDAIYREQSVIGAFYTSALAYRLKALGYTIERTDEHGNFEIAGFTSEQLAHFSQRRAEIAAALKAKGIDIKEATAQQKEDATLKTRAHKKSVNHDALIDSWKVRAQEVGIDFESIRGRAASRQKESATTGPRPLQKEPTATDALSLMGLQAMEFSIKHLSEREAVFSKEDLLSIAMKYGTGEVPPDEVEKMFEHLRQIKQIIELPNRDYTTPRMLHSEKRTLDQVRAQKGQVAQIMTPEVITERLNLAEKQQGFAYTSGQKEAITHALSTQDRYIAVQGLAGTGKTTMLKGLREIAVEQGYTVRGMAPTGAATKTLKRSTGIQADTVSMFLLNERRLQKDINFAKRHAPDFVRKSELWIVDESSFLAQFQKAEIDVLAKKAGARVVFLGDILQLQGIEAGKPFELAVKNEMKTAYMTQISRQKTIALKRVVDIVVGRDQLESGRPLTKIELNRNVQAFAYMDKTGMVYEVEKNLSETMLDDFFKLSREERESTIIITPFKKERQEINDGMRQKLKELGEVFLTDKGCEILTSKDWTRAQMQEAKFYQAGDVVRFGRHYRSMDVKKGEYVKVEAVNSEEETVLLRKENGETLTWMPKKHHKVEVYESEKRDLAVGDWIRFTRNGEIFKNGERARVQQIEGQKVSLTLGEGATPALQPLDLSKDKHWDHAYAVTVHSAQGATQKRAIFHIPAKREKEDDKRMATVFSAFGTRSFYVGATRASHELKIYTNDKGQAMKMIAHVQDKTSAVAILQKHERNQPAVKKQADLMK